MIRVFFSLVDYRNKYFTSNDPNKIIEFYNGFDNREQLIQWMRERPKGVANMHEVEGDKDIIVVIPTADFNGKYARECRENIFKGLHMVFVESGEVPDPYFNYAHNCNVGIKKAMEYNPKWVVVSNDDMVKIDDVDTLKRELTKINYNEVSAVFTTPSIYHSVPVKLAEPRLIFNLYMRINKQNRTRAKLWKKFNVRLFLPPVGLIWSVLYRRGIPCFSISAFGIFSSIFLKDFMNENNGLFDESFITATEDIDLSLKVTLVRDDFKFINYRIGDLINGTVGSSFSKLLRDAAGDTLLNYLVSSSNDYYHHKIRKKISSFNK
ncbi:MAG: hypothetical protein M1159_03425 [Candidatus Thermoplasmatota archaeon]|jgi:hypothetical protein|nr:hypothetical protein [Candidatus Thermoplasmatota archaeon]